MRRFPIMSSAHSVGAIGAREIDSVVVLRCVSKRHMHSCLCAFGTLECIQLPNVGSSQQRQNRLDIRNSKAYHTSNSSLSHGRSVIPDCMAGVTRNALGATLKTGRRKFVKLHRGKREHEISCGSAPRRSPWALIKFRTRRGFCPSGDGKLMGDHSPLESDSLVSFLASSKKPFPTALKRFGFMDTFVKTFL